MIDVNKFYTKWEMVLQICSNKRHDILRKLCYESFHIVIIALVFLQLSLSFSYRKALFFSLNALNLLKLWELCFNSDICEPRPYLTPLHVTLHFISHEETIYSADQ